MKKIIAIGLKTNQKQKLFTGQAMMFDAMVDFLKSDGYDTDVIDLSSKQPNQYTVGKLSYKRFLSYVSILILSVGIFLRKRKSLLYLNSAQTKGGFMRDYFFINLASVLKYKIVLQHFGSNFDVFYSSLNDSMKKRLVSTFSKASVIIVEGEYTKKQFNMIPDYEQKVVPITNGLPEKKLKTSLKGKVYKPNDTFNLLYLSNMIETKGYWDVLKAVNILVSKRNRNVNCVFAGGFKALVDDKTYKTIDSAKTAFFQFIKDNNLESNVTYYKGLGGEAKADAFLKSNVFLLPSYYKFEGQPVSVLEAMAYGSVPIVTKHRLIPNMVTDNTGYFVPSESPEQIAEAVISFMDNPELYSEKSQNSINRYLENFTLEKYCNKISNLLNSI